MALGLALPRHQFQLRQVEVAQITAERAGQAKRPGRAIQVGLEVAQVVAIGVRHFAVESAQVHLRLGDDRVQSVPGKRQPVDLRVGLHAFLPVHSPGQVQVLLGADGQIQCRHLRARGVYPPLEQHTDGGCFGGQAGATVQHIAVLEVALGRQHKLIVLQGVRQLGAGLERVSGDTDLCWQVLGQRLQLAF